MKQGQKPCIKTKRVTDRENSKAMNEVKAVENKSKNPQSCLGTSSMQKKVPTSHKLQDHDEYERTETFWPKRT